MLLRIQKNESLRSYVERNIFVPNTSIDSQVFQSLSRWDWHSSEVKIIAKLLGWHGCYGFNKLLHGHTIYPWESLLKSRLNHSYSGHVYISDYQRFDSLSAVRSYCPICAKEDKLQLGYSYWRRIFPEVKVCAKHNVLLLTACEFCDKPFARSGHAVSVMWGGCSGRHLWEAQPVENLDPSALRLAQFFDDLCQADHHIYIDTAAVVLEARLIEKATNYPTAPLENGALAEFQRYIENSGLYDVIDSWAYHSLSSELIELAASFYGTFFEFAADCHKLEANAPSINYFWDTYCCFGQCSEHFIKENYRLGVAEWSWPAFEDLSRDPFVRDHSLLSWSPGRYSCCNPSETHPGGVHPAYASLPGVPRLRQDEMLAIS